MVYDQDTHRDRPLLGCQRTPEWWTPHSGVEHNGTTIGVRWRCEQCCIEGKGIFGPARDLTEIASKALHTFVNSRETKSSCVYFTTPVEHYSG